MVNKPSHSNTTDNSTSTNTNRFTPPSNDTSENANNPQLSSMEFPKQGNNNMQDFKNNALAMGPNNTSSNNTSLIITLSSIALLIIAILGVSLFKKRKYIS